MKKSSLTFMFIVFAGSIHAASPLIDSFVDFHKIGRTETNPILVEKKIICPAKSLIVRPEFKITSFLTDAVENDKCGIVNRNLIEFGDKIPVCNFGLNNFYCLSERPTTEVEDGSNNVNKQSPNIFEKQNNDGGQSINKSMEFLKATEHFLESNENLIHMILLAVFLLLTKKLFIGRF
jgi:hypothetical protein